MKPDHKLIEEFADQIRGWRHTGRRDPTMTKLFSSDRKQLRSVLSLFRRGKYLEAGLEAHLLDTILRDVIPDRAWRYMNNARTQERAQ